VRAQFKASFLVSSAGVSVNEYEIKGITCLAGFVCYLINRRTAKSERGCGWDG
jgi:hypothetical protein